MLIYDLDPYAKLPSYMDGATEKDIEWHALLLKKEFDLPPTEAERLSKLGAAALQQDAWERYEDNQQPSRNIMEAVFIRSEAIHRELPGASQLLIIGAVATAYGRMLEKMQGQKVQNNAERIIL